MVYPLASIKGDGGRRGAAGFLGRSEPGADVDALGRVTVNSGRQRTHWRCCRAESWCPPGSGSGGGPGPKGTVSGSWPEVVTYISTSSEAARLGLDNGFSLQSWKQYGTDGIGGVNPVPVEVGETIMPRGPALSKACRKRYNIKVDRENVVLYRNEGGIMVTNVFPRRPNGQEERMLAFRRLVAEMVIRAVKH